MQRFTDVTEGAVGLAVIFDLFSASPTHLTPRS